MNVAPAQERPAAIAAQAAESLALIRSRAPAVHCITNLAATAFTANVLLALGAVPSLSFAADEVADFARSADALLINLGTLDEPRRAAIGLAIEAAAAAGRPWVLDPVFVYRAPARLSLAGALIGRKPAVIRANRAELAALAQAGGIGSGDEPAADFALATGTCVALTGAEDQVSDGRRLARIANGHELMTRVTAMGCALGAVIGAFLAVVESPFAAAAQAVLAFGVAGEVAGEDAAGPGTFSVRFIDALYGLDAHDLERRARGHHAA